MIREKPKLEYNEQVAVTNLLEMLKTQGKVVVFSAVPNNTYTKSWKQKLTQKLEGVRSGVPDMIIVLKDKVLFLEMKRTKGGTVSDSQKVWLDAVKDKTTVSAVAKGFGEAEKIIKELIK